MKTTYSSWFFDFFIFFPLLILFIVPTQASPTSVIFSGVLLESPPCVINDGSSVVVDFGDELMTTHIDGDQYRKKIEFTLDCSSAISSKQRIRISGNTSVTGFNGEVLATPKAGLGIAIYHDNVRYSPGEWINFNAPTIPTFYAVPQKQDDVKLTGGEFHVTASLVIDYQ